MLKSGIIVCASCGSRCRRSCVDYGRGLSGEEAEYHDGGQRERNMCSTKCVGLEALSSFSHDTV
jgi:hypothetical protein